MGKVPVEINFVLMLSEEQKEAFDKMLFESGLVQIKTLNGNEHDIEIEDFNIMEGEDYIFKVNKNARSLYNIPGEVEDTNNLAI